MTKLVGTAAVARRLNVSERTVRDLASRGVLPALRLGERGRYRFAEETLEDLLERARGRGADSSAVEPEARSARSSEEETASSRSAPAPPLGDPAGAAR